jgi:hypothetical protein
LYRSSIALGIVVPAELPIARITVSFVIAGLAE